MTIRPTKCIFGASCVDFLGHRQEQGVLGLHEENVEKIKNALRPGDKSTREGISDHQVSFDE